MHKRTHMQTRAHTFMHIHDHIHAHAYPCTHTHTHTHTCAHRQEHMQKTYVYVCIHIQMHSTHTHTHTHTYTHTCTLRKFLMRTRNTIAKPLTKNADWLLFNRLIHPRPETYSCAGTFRWKPWSVFSKIACGLLLKCWPKTWSTEESSPTSPRFCTAPTLFTVRSKVNC